MFASAALFYLIRERLCSLLNLLARPVATGSIRGKAPQIALPPNFVVPRKFLIKTYIKNKNFASLKIYLAPQTLKSGYGPATLWLWKCVQTFWNGLMSEYELRRQESWCEEVAQKLSIV